MEGVEESEGIGGRRRLGRRTPQLATRPDGGGNGRAVGRDAKKGAAGSEERGFADGRGEAGATPMRRSAARGSPCLARRVECLSAARGAAGNAAAACEWDASRRLADTTGRQR